MEYSLLCFSNLKILLIGTVPRTRVFGLWRFIILCVCVCVCFSSLCDFHLSGVGSFAEEMAS